MVEEPFSPFLRNCHPFAVVLESSWNPGERVEVGHKPIKLSHRLSKPKRQEERGGGNEKEFFNWKIFSAIIRYRKPLVWRRSNLTSRWRGGRRKRMTDKEQVLLVIDSIKSRFDIFCLTQTFFPSPMAKTRKNKSGEQSRLWLNLWLQFKSSFAIAQLLLEERGEEERIPNNQKSASQLTFLGSNWALLRINCSWVIGHSRRHACLLLTFKFIAFSLCKCHSTTFYCTLDCDCTFDSECFRL